MHRFLTEKIFALFVSGGRENSWTNQIFQLAVKSQMVRPWDLKVATNSESLSSLAHETVSVHKYNGTCQVVSLVLINSIADYSVFKFHLGKLFCHFHSLVHAANVRPRSLRGQLLPATFPAQELGHRLHPLVRLETTAHEVLQRIKRRHSINT